MHSCTVEVYFIIKDPESSIKVFLALVPTFATALIHQRAVMKLAKEKQQPPMQLLHAGNNCGQPLFDVITTHIVSTRMLLWAADHFLLIPQPDCTWCYLTNMIDMNPSDLF
jgi:hypothetical protein